MLNKFFNKSGLPIKWHIEQRKLSELRRWDRNPRIIKGKPYEDLKKSIGKFGLAEPLVIQPDGLIIGGHARYEAMLDAKLEECDCYVPGCKLKDKEVEELNIRLNRPAGEFDYDALANDFEISDLLDYGFEEVELGLDVYGGSNDGFTDPDATPEPPKTPKTKPGDLYILGEHRLLCGDATKKEDVDKLMDGQKAVLMNTDPPYGINYGDIANSRDRALNKKQGGDGKNYKTRDDKKIINDELDGEKLQEFLESIIRTALPHLIENPAFYLWHPMLTQGTFFAAAAAADILIHRQIIWVKPSLIMGRGDYHWRHELCFYGWIKGKKCQWLMGRDQDTIWEVGRENNGIHPTQKPVELFIRPIKNHTREKDICYEPFSGSGSQFIAAEQTGRRCFGLEIDPGYCDVIVQRFEAFTNKKAILERG